MEDLEVLKHRLGELDAHLPTLSIEQLDLHPAPERFDHGVVVAFAHRSHRRAQSGLHGPRRELPGHELRPLVAVDHRLSAKEITLFDHHAEGIRHQGGCRLAIDLPLNDTSTEGIQDNGAVELPFSGGMLGNVRDSELARSVPIEVSLYTISGARRTRDSTVSGTARDPLQPRSTHEHFHGLQPNRNASAKRQLRMHRARVIAPTRFDVHPLDLVGELDIVEENALKARESTARNTPRQRPPTRGLRRQRAVPPRRLS